MRLWERPVLCVMSIDTISDRCKHEATTSRGMYKGQPFTTRQTVLTSLDRRTGPGR